jgi:hypothetical protein
MLGGNGFNKYTYVWMLGAEIDSPNVYGFLRNTSLHQTDALGLAAAPNLHQILRNKLWNYVRVYEGSEVADVFKVWTATILLSWVEPETEVKVNAGKVGSVNSASYDPVWNTMYLRDLDPTERDVTHELVHAFNDLHGTPMQWWPSDDERSAYAYTGLIEQPIQSAVNMERNFAKKLYGDCPTLDELKAQGKKFGNVTPCRNPLRVRPRAANRLTFVLSI